MDAYPFPRIDDLINILAEYSVFSTFDLKSAYHQFPILETDSVFIAIEADGKLWQYKKIPYGVINRGINFQRVIDRIIDDEENLNDVFAYQDDVTVCGRKQQEHVDNYNVQKLLSLLKRRNFTFNESKTVKVVCRINVLSYQVSYNTKQPTDYSHLKNILFHRTKRPYNAFLASYLIIRSGFRGFQTRSNH